MINREIIAKIEKHLESTTEKRIQFIWGPRRAGKSTILRYLSSKYKAPIFNFDLINDRSLFVNERNVLNKLKDLPVILIDEVQNFPGSTIALKILHDEFSKKIIATGSTELRQIASQEFDSLAGRFISIYCYPLSLTEITNHKMQENSLLDPHTINFIKTQCLIYGGYPEVYLEDNNDSKIKRLEELIDTYILKDIVNIYDLKDINVVKNLLIKISAQIGSEMSLNDLGNVLGIDKKTVSNYLSILERTGVLVNLTPYNTNIKKAVVRPRKYYFVDLGIRNVLIKDFREMELRPDKGVVFENLIISELVKRINYLGKNIDLHFYRDYAGKEVDIVMENYQKKCVAIEVKYKGRKTQSKLPFESDFFEITMNNTDTLYAAVDLL